jgi:acylphosphatase
MSDIQRHVYVTGRVQGVGFRASTLRQAARYSSLRGFVRNLDDGRVEAVFAGEEREVLEMVAWCRKGPPASKVSALEVIEENVDLSAGGFRVT